MTQAGNVAITWWGCATVEIRLQSETGDETIAVDPYLFPQEPRCRYIFCTHEHYDHCHEPTLRQLCQGDRFERLIVSPGCLAMSRLESPVTDDPQDLRFVPPDRLTALYPLHASQPSALWNGPTALALGRLRVEGVESSETPRVYRDGTPVDGVLPTTGYLIEDTSTGVSFYHPGDIHATFDQLGRLRGRVTYMFYPLGKTWEIEMEIIDLVQPEFLIPIHYRLADPDFPVPLRLPLEAEGILDPQTGADLPDVSPEHRRLLFQPPVLQRIIGGHWYPTPRDPLGDIARIEAKLAGLSRFLVLKAGVSYRLDN
ncbi:MAG: MBL fold metallo-hydrolase [Chloroflexi bacterium]|nr:MBL fold metallo-hydrolase [Chloroflexota bacterium]